MEKIYNEISKLLATEKGVAICFHPELELILIVSYDCLMHDALFVRLYSYCSEHSLCCSVSWSPVSHRLSVFISNFSD